MVRFSIHSLRQAKLALFIYSLNYPFTYAYTRLKTLSNSLIFTYTNLHKAQLLPLGLQPIYQILWFRNTP